MDENGSANSQSSPGSPNQVPGFAINEPSPPISVPDHRLLRCIGKGSYGSVWLAQNMMGMYRAVKIVHRNSFEHHRPFERELSGILKFEPISRSHEGFVDVLHVGIRERDFLYYVMELGDDEISGQNIIPEKYSAKTLARKISAHGKLSFDECLNLGLAISNALAELHKHGLVHRDIKPSNIIYISGAPKLADIGLVASTAEARSYVGTEGFIPPEGPGAPTADIYSFGKVLYEASTGKDRLQYPELPTLLDEISDQQKFLELNEIILRACETEPGHRYQSAADMHADLVVLASGESVKRLRFLERRFSSLKKIAGAATAAVLVAGVVLYFVYHAYAETRRRQIGAYVELGTKTVEAGNFLGALSYFAEAASLETAKPRATDDRLRFGSTLAQCPKLIQMWSGPLTAQSVSFDSTGQQVLIVENFGTAQLFDIKTGEPVSPKIGEGTWVFSAALSPDGNLIATASQKPDAYVWSRDGTKRLTLVHSGNVHTIVFSPDGQRIATACNDNLIHIWNVADGSHLLTIKGHGKGEPLDGLLSVVFSHNGKMIASTARDNTARIWDANTGRQLAVMEHTTWPVSVAFSPDDRQLATGCFDHKARVWDVESGKEVIPAMPHDDAVSSVEFSPDGGFILTGGLDRTARIWNASDHQPFDANPILRHSDRVMAAAIAPDGHYISTACVDGTTRVWDLAGQELARDLGRCSFSENAQRFVRFDKQRAQIFDALDETPVSPVLNLPLALDVKLSSDGNFLIAVSSSETTNDSRKSIQILDAVTGKPIKQKFLVPNECRNFSLSRDARRLLTFFGRTAQVLDAETGGNLSPPMSMDQDLSATFSPDATKVAMWSGNSFELRNTSTGSNVFPQLKLDPAVRYVCFNADGSRFVTCCSDPYLTKCTAQIWETATGRKIGLPLRHNDGVLFAVFSPDGKRIVTASEDYTAILWDAQTGHQLAPPFKHANQVYGAAFSPDGRWVATTGLDKTVRIWNAETGEALTPPLRHVATLAYVSFLPDGRHLIAATSSGNIWRWTLPVDERPVEDLRRLAEVLSAGPLSLSFDSRLFEPESLKPLFAELKTKYSQQFSASSDDVAAWHEFEAGQCEAGKQWHGAIFHLERMLAAKPGDSSLAKRLEHARTCAEKSNGLAGSPP
jgi:WD40 repeat protein